MRVTLFGLCLVVVMVAAWARPVEAQLGGLIRRAGEAAKEKTAPKDPRAAEPAASTRNPFADPAIVFITQDQLGRFQKGLQDEVAQRNELRKSLAALKSPAEYQACGGGVATSPEFMKMMQDWAEAGANLTGDQAIKHAQKMQTDMAALMLKHCGIDPQKAQGAALERTKQIEAEASGVAMPPGYTPPAGTEPDTPAAKAQPFARAYGMLKERIPVFCGKLDAKAPLTPTPMTIGSEKVMVVKLPGQGQEYVFRQDEAQALTNGCGGVMASMNSLFDTQ